MAETMDGEAILAIVARKGFFSITLKPEDAEARAICYRLRRARVLKGGRRERKNIVFYPGEKFHEEIGRTPRPVP